jgi:hypothetical protein
MKTILEKQKSLESMVETMSNLKNDSSKKGQEMFIDYRTKCSALIEELRLYGVNEEKNPVFKNAVSSFNYWK